MIEILTQYSPLHRQDASNDSEAEDEERNIKTQCLKAMLEAGADLSLETYVGLGIWIDCFADALFSRCSVRLSTMPLGKPCRKLIVRQR